MIHSTKIGKTLFTINFNELGCGVNVYKDNVFMGTGQYYPKSKTLVLRNCPFEDIRVILEKEISKNVDSFKIKFPYVNGY